MKKLIKISAVIVGILVLLIIGLTIAVKSTLSSDRLKSIILPKAESMTGRKVLLDEINVSLFKGIVAKGLCVKERDGQEDFLKIGKFVLSYRLFPLIHKQLIISKIEIVSPSISIKRGKDGEFNFSDMMEKSSRGTSKTSEPAGQEHKSIPVAVVADRFFIQDANIKFVDDEKVIPDISILLDAEFRGGIEKDETPRLDFGLVSLREMKAGLRDLLVKVSGRVKMDDKTVQADLEATVGKDKIEISATAKDYRSAPEIIANIHAKTLDLQQLMAFNAGKKTQENQPPKKEGKVKPAKASEEGMMKKIKAGGEIKVDQGKYQDYTIKEVQIRYQFAKGIMKIDPLGLKFSSEGSLKTEGTLNGNLRVALGEPSGIQKSVTGVAVAKLGKGTIKESKIFDAIAFITGVSALKNPGFDDGLFNFNIRDEKIFLQGSIQSSLFKVSPAGVVDFEKRMDIPTELKLSPDITGKVKGRLATFKLFEDEQGWRVIPIEIKGTTDNPGVTLNEEALKKQLGRSLKKGIQDFLLEPKSGGKTKPKDLLKEFLDE